MAYELKNLRFNLTEKEMLQFLLKQVVETKTNDGEPFTILMISHSVRNKRSKIIFDVSFEATVNKDTMSYTTENGSLLSTDNKASFMGSVDLKIIKDSKED